MRKKVRVIGWYGKSNVGDEAYKLSFPARFPQYEFSFDAKEADICILGGGDILSESFVKTALAFPCQRRIAMSVSAHSKTPFELLKKLDAIYVRDRKSEQLLIKNNVPCQYMPDIATGLTPNREQGVQWLKSRYHLEELELYQKKVGIVFNAHLYHGYPDLLARDFLTLTKVVWDLARLMDHTSASFVMFPMSTQLPYDDRITNSMIGGRCKFWKKNLVIHEKLNVQETLDIISTFDAVISTRLHTSIFSMMSNVPFIDLTHHDKNRSYLDTLGLSDWSHSYWNFEYETVKERLDNILKDNVAEKRRLDTIRSQQLQMLEHMTEDVHFI